MAWQDELYQNYINNRMSPQGRQNYEYDINRGVIPRPEGWAQEAAQQIQQYQQQPPPPPAAPPTGIIQAAHSQETQPLKLPDELVQRFWNGQMSDEGMKNLFDDMRGGRVYIEPAEEPGIMQGIKQAVTGEGRIVAETEALPSWTKMPEMWQLKPETLVQYVGTMAAGPDEIATILKKNNPDIQIKQDSKGNYVFQSAIDGQDYAIKPGFRADDLPRAIMTTLVYGLGTRGKTILGRAGTAALTQAGIEATQEAAGGRFDATEIPVAAVFEGGGGMAGKAIAGLKGYLKSAPGPVKSAFKKIGVEIGENVPTELEQAVQTAEAAGVTPMTSDVFPPRSFSGKTAQMTTERIPIVGTGGKRVQQQADRVQAVRNLLSDYGADEAARASDDVMRDLIGKRGVDLKKYTELKKDVIDRLSIEPKELEGAMGHRPTESGATLDDISMGGEFVPEDIYTHPEWYANTSYSHTKQSIAAIRKYKGKPDATVTIYRAGPKDQLRNGDWVTLSKKYAEQEALTEGVPVHSFKVKAKDVQFAGDDLNEFGYFGEGINVPRKNLVPISKTESAIQSEIDRLSALGNKDVEPLIAALDDARTSFGDKTLAQMEDNRKIFGEKLYSDNFATIRTQAEKVNRKIYGAVVEDMGEYIKTNGQPRDYNKWKVANKRLENMAKNLDITALKSTLKKGNATPEEVRKLLFSRKPSDIGLLYRSLTPDGKARARVAILQEAMEKAGPELSTAKFRSALGKLEKSTGVFFKGQDRTTLDGLIKTLDMTKRAEVSGVQPPTGTQNFQIIGAFGLGSLLGGFKGATTAGSIGAAARVYESKPVRDLLIKIAKGKGDEQKYINALVNVLKTKHQFTKKPVSAAEQRRALEIVGGRI